MSPTSHPFLYESDFSSFFNEAFDKNGEMQGPERLLTTWVTS